VTPNDLAYERWGQINTYLARSSTYPKKGEIVDMVCLSKEDVYNENGSSGSDADNNGYNYDWLGYDFVGSF